jgi:excisionase family DNA binding protein
MEWNQIGHHTTKGGRLRLTNPMNNQTQPTLDLGNLRSNPPVNLSLAEAAAYIGVSRRMVWNAATAGGVKVARVGRRLIFKRSELDRWLEVHEQRRQRGTKNSPKAAHQPTHNE